MRGLITKCNRYLLVLFVGLALLLCSLATLSAHTKTSSTQSLNCASSCEQHAQPTITSPVKESELKEKEPIPPPYFTVLQQASAYPYLITVAISLAYLYMHRKLLLTTHLKF
jgi:hypothetical protein